MKTPEKNISDLPLIIFLHRFDKFITMGLVVLISIMVLSAFWGLVIEIYHLVLHGAFNTLDLKAFQSAFGMIMTLLIAIEFSRVIMHSYVNKSHEIIVKTVVLIAILAVSRQFIVSEMDVIAPLSLAALAFSLLSLGLTYWIMERAPVPTVGKE
ncbi:MAG: phosphate-starvation-inducible PsiE family protein [Gallionella sp.]